MTALLASEVEVVPLSSSQPPDGAVARRMGPLMVSVGTELVGRTIDCLGQPLDGAAPLSSRSIVPVFGRPARVVDAVPGNRLTIGAMVYDLQRFIRAGTSLLATGRREVLHHILRHQVACGRIVIVANPFATEPNHHATRRGDVRCIQVSAPPDATPAQCWLVPLTAMAIGEGLRDSGCEVVVALDDLDAWIPHATRPSTRAAPWETQLGQLASRAYASHTGSVSLIAMTRRVSMARTAAFDETLDLDIAMSGDVPLTGTKRVVPPFRTPSVRLLGAALDLAEMRRRAEDALALYPDRFDEGAREELARSSALRECLRHRASAPVDSLEQQLSVMAVAHQRNIRSEDVVPFVNEFLTRVRREHAVRLAKIRTVRALTADDEETLLACAAEIRDAFGGS